MRAVVQRIRTIPIYRYTALVVAAALVFGLVVLTRALLHDDRSCAAGVARPEDSDECVGVSTSAFDFGQRPFADTIRAVARENSRLKPGTYVTVALFEPFTATDADTMNDVRHELQGAYLAQYHSNHDGNGETPYIRLVLANPGASGAYWERTVDRIVTMTRSSDRLRAVTGIGTSTDNNKKAVAKLTRLGVPVIGTSITADDLANGQRGKDPYPGLARVAPTNTDEARALASFAKVTADRALLVYDKPGDPYTKTLQGAFSTLLKGSPYGSWPFTPPADRSQEGSTPNTFRQISDLICDTDTKLDTVFFAGRHTQLRQFINALGRRGCQSRSFTVLTGDEGSYLTGDKKLDRSALRHGVAVRYTSLAHPDAWLKRPPASGGSAQDTRDLDRLLTSAKARPVGPIGPVSLDDGQAIIAYDATRLAVHGIREATPDQQKIPPLADVGLQWPQVKGSLRVNGASGWICLDVHGNPYDKAVPIVELTPQGGSRFVKIAWPEDGPPAKDCLPPA
ncbi:ABC transporter substrate-binding protein [Streptomyces sp. NPDC096013]|uniref:ABC transporter substrate-binding protein n=1 Tax=Streptomyces sp. NPDC096013 TaxID=3366069 RepID=UPI0037FD6E13